MTRDDPQPATLTSSSSLTLLRPATTSPPTSLDQSVIMVPVQRLSEDLLRVVLQLVINEHPDEVWKWIRLTEVCRTWQTTMLGNGAFWAQIWSSNARIIRRMLVLSLDAPLDINLLFGDIMSPMPEIFDLIAPHMRRVRLLYIPLSQPHILENLFSFGCPMPHLVENLHLYCHDPISPLAYIYRASPSSSTSQAPEYWVPDAVGPTTVDFEYHTL
jgi:hypothetical protein